MTTHEPGPPDDVNAPGDGADATQRRRQLVNLSLERRPSLSLDRLHAVLVTFNLDTDDDILIGDLTCLGYSVADGTVVPARDDAEGTGRRREGVPEGDGPEEHQVRGAGGDGGGGGLRHALRSRPRAAALVATALVAVVVIGLVILLPRDDGEDAQEVATDATAGVTAKERPVVAPRGPGSDPRLASADAREDFNRPSGPLGSSLATGEWTVVRGTWAIVDGRATVDRGDEPLTLATIELGTADVRAQVTVTDASRASGLAFRVVDEANYWLWTIAPDFATFVLTQVKGGEATVIGNSGLTSTKPGSTLGVHADGKRIELLANGAVVKRFDDDAATPGTRIGLATMGRGPAATFDDLIFQRAP